MQLKGMNRYQTFAFRPWLEHFFEHGTDCFTGAAWKQTI